MDEYVAFLLDQEMIAYDGLNYTITNEGLAFLGYLETVGYHESQRAL